MGHIPTGESRGIEILSFADALSASGLKDEYDSKKWLYVPDFYTEYRYILGVRGDNPLICIGINPSTAAPDNLDNTLKSVARIADANAYDGWMMFNVYAQRATDPDDMDLEFNESLHTENMKAFEYILSNVGKEHRPAVWAAWGTIIEKRNYLPACVRDMVQLGMNYNAQWLCAGKCSKKGHPHHPLYLKKDEVVYPFDVEVYLNGAFK